MALRGLQPFRGTKRCDLPPAGRGQRQNGRPTTLPRGSPWARDIPGRRQGPQLKALGIPYLELHLSATPSEGPRQGGMVGEAPREIFQEGLAGHSGGASRAHRFPHLCFCPFFLPAAHSQPREPELRPPPAGRRAVVQGRSVRKGSGSGSRPLSTLAHPPPGRKKQPREFTCSACVFRSLSKPGAGAAGDSRGFRGASGRPLSKCWGDCGCSHGHTGSSRKDPPC